MSWRGIQRVSDELTELATRRAIASDEAFVLSTWVRSYGTGVPTCRRKAAMRDFRRNYVDKIWSRYPHIVVVCSDLSPNTLHAYAVVLDGVLCWAYTALPLRDMGLARLAILTALGGYPELIRTYSAWPHGGTRYKFERMTRAA